MKKRLGLLAVVMAFVLLFAACAPQTPQAPPADGSKEGDKPPASPVTINVACQTWTEASILGYMTKYMIEENTDYSVNLIELESDVLIWEALKNNHVDACQWYTSSFFPLFEETTSLRGSDEIYDYVKTKAKEDHDIILLDKMGFFNNYDLAVTQELADKHNLKTYSDLAAVAKDYVLVADYNFLDRVDCYPLLKEFYGFEFKDMSLVATALKYEVIGNGEADAVHCYTTDSGVARYNLVLLEDDKNCNMKFDAVYVLRGEIADAHPELAEQLNKIKIDNAQMSQMNYEVEAEGKQTQDVAKNFLISAGLIPKS